MLQTKNSARNFSAMNPVAMKTADKKPDKTRGKPYHGIANWHFAR